MSAEALNELREKIRGHVEFLLEHSDVCDEGRTSYVCTRCDLLSRIEVSFGLKQAKPQGWGEPTMERRLADALLLEFVAFNDFCPDCREKMTRMCARVYGRILDTEKPPEGGLTALAVNHANSMRRWPWSRS